MTLVTVTCSPFPFVNPPLGFGPPANAHTLSWTNRVHSRPSQHAQFYPHHRNLAGAGPLFSANFGPRSTARIATFSPARPAAVPKTVVTRTVYAINSDLTVDKQLISSSDCEVLRSKRVGQYMFFPSEGHRVFVNKTVRTACMDAKYRNKVFYAAHRSHTPCAFSKVLPRNPLNQNMGKLFAKLNKVREKRAARENFEKSAQEEKTIEPTSMEIDDKANCSLQIDSTTSDADLEKCVKNESKVDMMDTTGSEMLLANFDPPKTILPLHNGPTTVKRCKN